MRLRGAHGFYAELVGYGATGDAFHITSPQRGRKRRGQSAWTLAMEEGWRRSRQEVEYINAHGTATASQ